MENLLHWAEEHPWLAGGLTLGIVFLFLWLFGAFGSSSSSSSSSNGTNLAAAYYNAEAAQTTAGTQLQMATVAYGAQTAQTQIQANAATAIAASQSGAATTINGQNASAATTINASNNSAAVSLGSFNSTVQQALGYDALLGTINSNDDALATANTNGYWNNQSATTAATAGEYDAFLTNVLPAEIANAGPTAVITAGLPGIGTFGLAGPGGISTPSSLESVGYTPAGAASLLGVPYPGYTT